MAEALDLSCKGAEENWPAFDMSEINQIMSKYEEERRRFGETFEKWNEETYKEDITSSLFLDNFTSRLTKVQSTIEKIVDNSSEILHAVRSMKNSKQTHIPNDHKHVLDLSRKLPTDSYMETNFCMLNTLQSFQPQDFNMINQVCDLFEKEVLIHEKNALNQVALPEEKF